MTDEEEIMEHWGQIRDGFQPRFKSLMGDGHTPDPCGQCGRYHIADEGCAASRQCAICKVKGVICVGCHTREIHHGLPCTAADCPRRSK